MYLNPADLRIDTYSADLRIDTYSADLRIDTYSNGIRGGSCVRITHLPTGMVSSCDSDCLVHLGTYGISNERKACAMRTIELIFDRELNKHYKDPSMSLLKRDENLTREEIESEKKISEAKKIEKCKAEFVEFFNSKKEVCYKRDSGKSHYIDNIWSITKIFDSISVKFRCVFCEKAEEIKLTRDIEGWIRDELSKMDDNE